MRGFACLILALLASGCAHTYRVTSSGARNSISLEDLNEYLQDNECTIYLTDETTRNARHAALTRDSILWQDSREAVDKSLPLSRVDRLEVSDKSRGFVDAMFVGTVGAAMLVFMGPRGGGSFLVAPAYPEAAAVFVVSAGIGAFSSSTRRFLVQTSR